MAEHNNIGAKGENIAKEFLLGKGYHILECNWRYQKLEADIIAKHDNMLVFIEVKTRTDNYFGEPEEFVGPGKQKNLIDAAQAFIDSQAIDLEVRFDVISIIISKSGTTVNHIVDAFYPEF